MEVDSGFGWQRILPLMVLTLTFFTLGDLRGQLVIGEFLADPSASQLDDDGDPSGWIEITNNGATDQPLVGYHLTNDAALPTKWTFTGQTILAGESVLVYASGKDRTDPVGIFHTNFVLDAAGSYLGLIAPDGTTVTSEFAPSFPEQFTGLSYGINYSGAAIEVELVPWGADAAYHVPTDNSLGTTWRNSPANFDDSSWTVGSAPLGFGLVSGVPIQTQIPRTGFGSAYFRFPFDLNLSSVNVTEMTISAIADDGFVAFINGVETHSLNAPPSLTWNSFAAGFAEGEQRNVTINSNLGAMLVDGANTLAIQGMNLSAGSSDFAIDARVTAKLQGVGTSSAGYFETPTPWLQNGVYKSSQAISFGPLADIPFTPAPINLAATASSGLPVSYTLVSGNATLAGSELTLTGLGAVTITADQAGSSGYLAAATVEQTFKVAQAAQAITFPNIESKVFDDVPFTPIVNASSGLPVVLSVLSGPATTDGSVLTITGVGDVSVQASQAGDTNWLPAADVTQVFAVGKASQSIVFEALADRAFDSADFDLVAGSSSRLPVSFEVTGPAVLTGDTVTLNGAGAVTVRAIQLGDDNFAAAEVVEHTFVAGYTLSLQSGAGGSISATPEKLIYAPGEIVSLAVFEDAGQRFISWGDALTGNVSPSDLTMNAHSIVSAQFKKIWNFSVSAGENGSVTVDPQKAEYLDGDVVTLTPVPDSGYGLESWGGDASGDVDPLMLTLSADTSVTASFVDIEDPVVQIFSPTGGVTNNQISALFGSVSDNDEGTVLTWERNGVSAGGLANNAGSFGQGGLVLVRGDNVFTVIATDPTGNEGRAEVTLTWEPDRTLSLGSPPETREGKLISVPITLDSSGNVAGMTFTLGYDPQFLGSVELSLSGVGQGITQVNTDTPGQVRVTLALPANPFPAGEVFLGTASFRARSVPFDLTSFLELAVTDVSGSDGNQISIGTDASGAEVRILKRLYTGDINTNDRLDTGDAFLMQRLLTGADELRTWDTQSNDLNGSFSLDSGDVVRVLRTIVGLDDQPGGQADRRRSARSNNSGPKVRLELDKNHGVDGEEVTMRVMLEAPGYAPAGAAFSIDYPVDALRLTDASSHDSGAIVSGDSLIRWNVAPSGNDYANQTGTISFVAASSQVWSGSEVGGELASFRFKVQSGAALQPLWEIDLRQGQLPSNDGFDVFDLSDASVTFIGQATTFSSWLELFLDVAQLADPQFSDPASDPDGDGMVNLVEYGQGTNPMLAETGASTRFMLETVDGVDYPAIEFQRSLTAIDLDAVVEFSTDLSTWVEADETTSAVTSQILQAGGASERVVVRETVPSGQFSERYLRVRYILVE